MYLKYIPNVAMLKWPLTSTELVSKIKKNMLILQIFDSRIIVFKILSEILYFTYQHIFHSLYFLQDRSVA